MFTFKKIALLGIASIAALSFSCSDDEYILTTNQEEKYILIEVIEKRTNLASLIIKILTKGDYPG